MFAFIKYLLKTAFYWLLLFAFYRLLFIVFNMKYAGDTPFSVLLASFGAGLRLDCAMAGYMIIPVCLSQTVSLVAVKRFTYKVPHLIHYIFTAVFSILLVADILLYNYWSKHLDAEALSYLATPWAALSSMKQYEFILFLIASAALSWLAIWFYRRLSSDSSLNTEQHTATKSKGNNTAKQLKLPLCLLYATAALFTGAVMIIPIRGGFGTAPNNTGVAYFSSSLYANHAALNPLWNLFYSFNRLDARKKHYRFMDDETAQNICQQMMTSAYSTDTMLKTTSPVLKNDAGLLKMQRPNIAVILLESFSAQVIGALGSKVAATPCFDALSREGILFSNIYAAGFRSEMGITATMAGYQVLPTYSIMQYPAKSQSLAFLPKRLKEAGYGNLTYLYAGDIEFKNMNSFVTLAGFDKTLTITDFPRSMRARQWGVYDEYSFARFASEIENEKGADTPWFKFFFTLSSHEPFTVPMKTKHSDPYVNSVMYTDSCLGVFFDRIKASPVWDSTLFVLIADHGMAGPANASFQSKERFHIPMLWTGGALAVMDTVVNAIGSQTDLAATLLNQLNIPDSGFLFSKNILDSSHEEFAFFVYPDAFGMITHNYFYVFDNRANRFIHFEGHASATDSIKGKAYLQAVSADHLQR